MDRLMDEDVWMLDRRMDEGGAPLNDGWLEEWMDRESVVG